MASTFRFECRESTRWDPPLLGEVLIDDGSSMDMESLSLLRSLSLLCRDTGSFEALESDRLIFQEPDGQKPDQSERERGLYIHTHSCCCSILRFVV